MIDSKYDEVWWQNRDKLKKVFEDLLESYNLVSRKPLNITLMSYSIMHLTRVHRLLRQSRGNGLLIGTGGSGRQSLTALAAFIANLNFVQLELTQDYSLEMWNDDIKRCLMLCGVDDRNSVFLAHEHHLRRSFMLEDINSILNSGVVQGLFTRDDKKVIREKLRERAKREGREQFSTSGSTEEFFEYFQQKVKQNLHIVLTMRPQS